MRPKAKTKLAKKLRQNMTDAERKVWNILRKKQLENLHFRRQAPVGPYIADFLCTKIKLVVEIDGGQHYDPTSQEYDEKRTYFMEDQGYEVIRFTNIDVSSNLEGVYARLTECAVRLLNSPPS